MRQELMDAFAQGFRGQIIGRDHPDYDEARKLYNAMIDKRPLVIARCADAADVIAALKAGRENGLPIAVRGGGHNGPGLGSVDNGLVVDLSAMKGVRVDPTAGAVRVGAGCTTGDVDHATQAFGQAVPFGIVSTTGVAGLTLSGGHGYLSRQYGLTIDNLLEVDMVLADGKFVRASESENPDLFWAVRGGGGNFGIVTSFLFRTHPVGMVTGGPIVFDLADAPEAMAWFRDNQPKAPPEFSMFLGLQVVPPADPFPEEHWSKKMCALVVCHTGPEAAGKAAVDTVRSSLPRPLFDWAQPMPYGNLQSLFDPMLPRGLQWYWKGDFVKALPDAAIETHVAHAKMLPSALSGMHIYPIDGAAQRLAPDATAWRNRDATWSMVIFGVDPDPANAGTITDWARAYWEAVHPYNMEGAYPNFMMDDEGEPRVRAAFGSNYERLARAKRTYDPDNVFRVNQNIRPAA